MFGRPKIPSITAKDLKVQLDQRNSLTLLDVRTQREWAQTGIVPGSITISMQTLGVELENGLNLKDKGQVVVICRSGARSGSVVNYLVNQLNIDAVNLEGGIIAWSRINGTFEQV